MSFIQQKLRKALTDLPAPVAKLFCHLFSVAIGGLAAFGIYYVLYRIGLPTTPFIYAAF